METLKMMDRENGVTREALENGDCGVGRLVRWLCFRDERIRAARAFVLVVVLACAPPTCFGAFTTERFECKGTISIGSGEGPDAPFCDFSIKVDGPESLIFMDYANGAQFEWGTDGIDSYLMNRMSQAKVGSADVTEFGSISTTSFPDRALAPIQCVWVAYASSAVLAEASSTENFLLEVFQDFRAGISMELGKRIEGTGLPLEIVWYSDGAFKRGSEVRQDLVNYPEGFLAATFSVLSTTNISGVELPLEWLLATYRAHGGDVQRARGDVIAVQRLKGKITSIVPLNHSGDFLPKITSKTSLTDWRYEDELGTGMPVPVIDGRWPKRGDKELVATLESYRASTRSVSSVSQSSRRSIVIAVVLVVTCLSAMYLVRKNKQQIKK